MIFNLLLYVFANAHRRHGYSYQPDKGISLSNKVPRQLELQHRNPVTSGQVIEQPCQAIEPSTEQSFPTSQGTLQVKPQAETSDQPDKIENEKQNEQKTTQPTSSAYTPPQVEPATNIYSQDKQPFRNPIIMHHIRNIIS